MKKLNKKIENILNNLGWSYDYIGDDDIEISNYSPIGENLVESLSIKHFSQYVKWLYEDFDVNEHVSNLIIEKYNGLQDVPYSISALLEDAKAIDQMYKNLAVAVSKVSTNE